ncbi:glycerate kinase-like [Pollicipes pollicipes]|uniref:glycerate kinase-like n=1 Tax=Pollicipes pollicipes TaxID=41117 RepID=UPI001884AEB5|nr:glycerate kinase-like [Pollicipes pollicipes]
MVPAGQRLRQLAAAAVDAVSPDQLVRRALQRHDDQLTVDGRSYTLSRNVYLVGAGKAVLGMAAAVEQLLHPHLVRGLLSVPVGARPAHLLPGIEVCEGAADNQPDAAAARTAGRIAELAAELSAGDLLLVLLSGGGSALLPAPRPPLTLPLKACLSRQLAERGASIQELNAARRGLSRLKGGGLARLARPARTLALILSDVVGDPLDLIASGPTCLLLGGETTVIVRGAGRGGRNQQLALAFALELERLVRERRLPPTARAALLCFGTDGRDGPTDAAGAVVDQAVAADARAAGLRPEQYLADNDSYAFFARFRSGAHHILVGQTGTNVMDVMALVVEQPPPRDRAAG